MTCDPKLLTKEELDQATYESTSGDSAQHDWLETWRVPIFGHIAALEREADKVPELVRVAEAHGWNGVDNAKRLATFLDNELSALAKLRAQQPPPEEVARLTKVEQQAHADRYAIHGVLTWSGHWPLGIEKVKPSRHVKAVLERLEKAEAENARLVAQAARVPGLETRITELEASEAEAKAEFDRGEWVGAAGYRELLERFQTAESERDAALKELEREKSLRETWAENVRQVELVLGFDRPDGMTLKDAKDHMAEVATLRERVATLEDKRVASDASHRDTERALAAQRDTLEGCLEGAKAREDAVRERADTAEARVRELEDAIRVLDAHIDFASPWEPGDLDVEDPSGINAAMAHLHALVSGASHPAPTTGAEQGADVSACVHCAGPIKRHAQATSIWLHDNSGGAYAGKQMDHDAEPPTPPPGLLEAARRVVTLHGEVTATTGDVADAAAASLLDAVGDLDQQLAAYDAVPVHAGLLEAVVEKYAEEQTRLCSEADAKSERDGDSHCMEACNREGRAAGAREVLSLIRAAVGTQARPTPPLGMLETVEPFLCLLRDMAALALSDDSPAHLSTRPAEDVTLGDVRALLAAVDAAKGATLSLESGLAEERGDTLEVLADLLDCDMDRDALVAAATAAQEDAEAWRRMHRMLEDARAVEGVFWAALREADPTLDLDGKARTAVEEALAKAIRWAANIDGASDGEDPAGEDDDTPPSGPGGGESPSRDDVLNAFAVEADPTGVLERYQREHPALAQELAELARALAQPLVEQEGPLPADDEALIDEAWKRHAAIGTPSRARIAPTPTAEVPALTAGAEPVDTGALLELDGVRFLSDGTPQLNDGGTWRPAVDFLRLDVQTLTNIGRALADALRTLDITGRATSQAVLHAARLGAEEMRGQVQELLRSLAGDENITATGKMWLVRAEGDVRALPLLGKAVRRG